MSQYKSTPACAVFPFLFFGGLLLFRISGIGSVKHAFLWCFLLLHAVLAMPRIGGAGHLRIYGLYDALSIILIFPLIVWMGASGQLTGSTGHKISRFLIDISYPIYITNYPLIYIYTAWVVGNKIPISEGWLWGIEVFFSSIMLG